MKQTLEYENQRFHSIRAQLVKQLAAEGQQALFESVIGTYLIDFAAFAADQFVEQMPGFLKDAYGADNPVWTRLDGPTAAAKAFVDSVLVSQGVCSSLRNLPSDILEKLARGESLDTPA